MRQNGEKTDEKRMALLQEYLSSRNVKNGL